MASPFSTANTAAAGIAPAADTRAPARGYSRGGNDDWKAQAFLNIYLPGDDDQPKKLASIPLKESDADHASIIADIMADPESLKRIIAAMTFTFQKVKERKAGFKY